MRMRLAGCAVVLVAGLVLGGCGGTHKAHRDAGQVRDDARRIQRIPDYSAPEVAVAAMGRKPDAVQNDGDREIHYYVIRGAVGGETLRLVYRDNKLVSQSIEQRGGGGE